MKKQIFKTSVLMAALASTFFAASAFSAIKPFESDYSNEIHGFQPIIESIGAVIIKKGESDPYAASKHANELTSPQVGDTLYVPVDVLKAVKDKHTEAYFDGVYTFADLDLDKEDPKTMAYSVEWYLLDENSTETSLKGLTPVQTNTASTGYGVPYIVTPEALGKKVAFRIKPTTLYGLPIEGEALEVMDISKLAGQKYPVDENGNPDPSQPAVVDTDKGTENNPNIDSGIVEIGSGLYEIAVYNSKGERVDGSAGVIPYVRDTFTVKINQLVDDGNGGKIYKPVTDDPEIKNNIIWKLYKVDGSEGHTQVVSTGLSADAQGDVAQLRKDPAYDPKVAAGADLSARLSEGTTQFTLQTTNENALHTEQPEFSEQGLQIRAVLIADDGE